MTKAAQILRLWGQLPNYRGKAADIAKQLNCKPSYVAQTLSNARCVEGAEPKTQPPTPDLARPRRTQAYPSSGWTESRVEKLKKLWAEGFSASRIAARLGQASRNAVISKVHRLGLPGRKTTTRKAIRNRTAKPKQRQWNGCEKKPSPIRAALNSIPVEPIPQALPEDIARVSFLELENHHCRFIPGDSQEGDALTAKKFCGLDAIPGTPYCPDHLPRCYTVYSPHRRPSPATPNPSAPEAREMGGGKLERVE